MKNIVIFAGGHGGIKLQQSIAKYAGNNVNVDIIKTKVSNFNINLNNLIGICEEKCKSLKINKIYCMSESCYNKYKENGMIISQGSEEYFRLFEKELWLVYKF